VFPTFSGTSPADILSAGIFYATIYVRGCFPSLQRLVVLLNNRPSGGGCWVVLIFKSTPAIIPIYN